MRRTWLVIVLAFAAVTWFYGLVLVLMARSAVPMVVPAQMMQLRWVLYGLGAAALVGGIWLYTRALSTPGLEPPGFQQRTILALAAIEATAICGLILGLLSRSIMDYVPLGAAAFVAIALWVLPRGLAHWNELEKR